MAEEQPTASPLYAGIPARRLRLTGVVVLVLGILAGSLDYWRSAAPVSLDGVSTTDNSKIVQGNIERNNGKMGLFASNLGNDLQNPGIRASIILVTACLVAGACFYFAHLMDHDKEEPGKVG